VQNQGWSSPDLPESAFLELDNRPIRIVDSLATLRLVPSAASSAAAEAAPSGSSSRFAAVLGGLLPNGTPIALKGGLEGHLQKEVGVCLAVSTEAIQQDHVQHFWACKWVRGLLVSYVQQAH